jgi:hypothetical protein
VSGFGFKSKADGVSSFSTWRLGTDEQLKDFDSFFTGKGVTGSSPINLVAPVVSGSGVVGQTLTTTNGTWSGTLPFTYTYQWQRSGSPISGATSQTYVLVDADADTNVRCVVTATNALGFGSAASNAIAVISYAQWLVNNFNAYVASQLGTVEADSCLLATLNTLNTIP